MNPKEFPTNNVLLVGVFSDFKFPLAEAVRKQIWSESHSYAKKPSTKVTLCLFCPKPSCELPEHAGVSVVYLSRRDFFGFFKKSMGFNAVHYFGSVGIHALVIGFIFKVFLPFKERILTIADGGVFSISPRSKSLLPMAKVVHTLYSTVRYYTQHQRSHFKDTRMPFRFRLVAPHLSYEKPSSQIIPYTDMTMLYMGHLSLFKGFPALLNLFEMLVKTYPSLNLIVANNGLRNEPEMVEIWDRFKLKFGDQVIEKGKINPIEELSRCHLFVYPFTSPHGTFAFPLSFYESLLAKTPFIGPSVAGVKEFFDPRFLADIQNPKDVLSKAEFLLENPSDTAKLISQNLNNLDREFKGRNDGR